VIGEGERGREGGGKKGGREGGRNERRHRVHGGYDHDHSRL